MGYRETSTYTVYEVEPTQTLDVEIELGKSVSQIAAADPAVVYRQNCLYAGKDGAGIWHPLGDLIKDGRYVQQGYGVMINWAYFVVPHQGRPYVGYIDADDASDIKRAFQLTPAIVFNGKKDIRSAQEKTATDIAYGAALRSAIGVKGDGTVVLVTTKVKLTLEQLADLMLQLGCIEAGNMDGGGSVTKNHQNEPYGVERQISSALVVRQGGKTPVKKKIIVLDAGHGGKDPGASGNGIVEKALALTIAHKVAWYLQTGYEVDVRMTRSSDTFVELIDRAKMANTAGADLFVSLHLNSVADASARGFESFVYNGQRTTATGRIQDVTHAAIATFAAGEGMPDRGKKTADLAVLRHTAMDALLLEFGFISNPADAALLRNDGYIESLALITADAIAKAMVLPSKVPAQPSTPETPEKDWKQQIHDDALSSGLIESDWSTKMDEPAPVWMVLKVALEAKKGAK